MLIFAVKQRKSFISDFEGHFCEKIELVFGVSPVFRRIRLKNGENQPYYVNLMEYL